jgi:periplasmic protein TonB
MGDLGNLRNCIIENDAGALKFGRRLRRKALVGSIFLETTLVGAMLVWPLITPGVLPHRVTVTPLAPFRSVQTTHVARPHSGASRPPTAISAVFLPPLVTQPPSTAVARGEIPDPNEIGIGGSPQTGIPGGNDDGAPINIPRPELQTGSVHIGGAVMQARLVHRVEPEYPAAAKILRVSGTVELRARIGTDGSVRQLEVVSGNPILARAASDAVQQWRYQPTRLNGQPVEVETCITVNFVMQ